MHINKPKGKPYYQALLRVPEDVRGIIGKTQFKKSLRTADKHEAQRLAAAIIPLWQREIEEARRSPEVSIAQRLEEHRVILRELREDLERAKTDAQHLRIHDTIAAIESEVEELVVGSSSDEDTAILAYKIVTGQLVPITEYLDEYIEQDPVNPRTALTKASRIRSFASSVPVSHVQEVDRKVVRRWLRDSLEGLSGRTKTKSLSFLGSYWDWLRDTKEIDGITENPFRGHRMPRERHKKERLPFTHGDLQRLSGALSERLKGNKVDPMDVKLYHTFLIAAYTGARIAEITSLTADRVDLERQVLTVIEAKTRAGNRTIPIHDRLLPLLRDLVRDAGEDGLLLDTGSQDALGYTAGPTGKRFGRLKRSLGYGEEHVFHSIRKAVATRFEQLGVPEGIAADILGHEKQTMTYGVYSGGTSIEQMRDAVDRLDWGLI